MLPCMMVLFRDSLLKPNSNETSRGRSSSNPTLIESTDSRNIRLRIVVADRPSGMRQIEHEIPMTTLRDDVDHHKFEEFADHNKRILYSWLLRCAYRGIYILRHVFNIFSKIYLSPKGSPICSQDARTGDEGILLILLRWRVLAMERAFLIKGHSLHEHSVGCTIERDFTAIRYGTLIHTWCQLAQVMLFQGILERIQLLSSHIWPDMRTTTNMLLEPWYEKHSTGRST